MVTVIIQVFYAFSSARHVYITSFKKKKVLSNMKKN